MIRLVSVPSLDATCFLSSKDGCKYLSYALLFQSPCNLIKSDGSPHWSAKLAPPRRNEWPEYLLAGYPRSLKQARSLTVKELCVRAVTLDPSRNRNKGEGDDGSWHSKNMVKREEEGQNTEFGIWGKGIISFLSRN